MNTTTDRTAATVGPGRARPDLVVLARAEWPEPGDGGPPALAGFVVSTFSPLVAAVAERCLARAYNRPGAEEERAARTAVVIATALGDVESAVHVADAVDRGARIGPLLFFQSVPNAVAGHIAARWGLTGPIVCTSPAGDPLAEARSVAALLIADNDCNHALLVSVIRDRAEAVLVTGGFA